MSIFHPRINLLLEATKRIEDRQISDKNLSTLFVKTYNKNEVFSNSVDFMIESKSLSPSAIEEAAKMLSTAIDDAMWTWSK